MVDCRYHCGGECRNRLALPVYGPRPSAGVCAQCQHRNGLRGLGDALAWLLSFVPLKATRKPCGACLKRRQALNQIAPNPLKPS